LQLGCFKYIDRLYLKLLRSFVFGMTEMGELHNAQHEEVRYFFLLGSQIKTDEAGGTFRNKNFTENCPVTML
jgi:hypothetical protein